jgi:hypothetical protein
MRFISKFVPAKKTASGKNSLIVGPWKVPSPVAAGRSRFTAVSSSAFSCFGAGSSALATTNE